MKHVLLLVTLTTALCTQSFSQTDTMWFDKKFKPTPKAYAQYYRPAPKKEGNNYRVLDYYKNGKLQGSALSASPDKDFWVGTMYGFFENGDTMFVTGYKNGVLNGKSIEYFPSGGKRRFVTFVNGKKHGTLVEYYTNGTINQQGFYKNDIPDSTWKAYTEKGELKWEYTLLKGKVHGKYFRTATVRDEPDYRLTFTGNFVNGNVVDYRMYYNDEKKPRTTATGINGAEEWKLRIGDTLLATCYFKNNKRTGEWKMYSPDGKKIMETITYFSDSCTDQEPVNLKRLYKGIVLPQRFSGYFDVNTDCSKGRYKRYDMTGRHVETVAFSPEGKRTEFELQGVPDELLYDILPNYFTFYHEPGYFPSSRYEIVVIEEEPVVLEAAVEEESIETEEPKIFTIVEQMPEFPGGDDSLWRCLKANFVYPPKAVELAIEGKVLVRFVISADGKVGDVTVLRGLQTDIDAEVVRVVKSLPAFKPGRQQGKAVAVYFNLPVPVKIKS